MKYAEECKAGYVPGREAEYIRCILERAHDESVKKSRGADRDVVVRATKALVRLLEQYNDGVPDPLIFIVS